MSVIIFIIILAVLIVVHEYGHFIVAKKWGIRVDEFGLGYPPRAKVLFKRKGTLFTLNWIPFGGFVKIFGESPDDESLNGENKGVALTSKSKFAQASVMFAGPLFNFLFAWLLILVSLFVGLPTPVSDDTQKFISEKYIVVNSVLENSPAKSGGVVAGDIIKNIISNDVFYEDFANGEDLKKALSSNNQQKIILDVQRSGETVNLEISPDGFEIEGVPAIGIGFQEVGIYKPPFFVSVVESFKITGRMIWGIGSALGGLVVDSFKGQADTSNLTGPVGIVALVGDANSLGFVYLISFIALISINLGIINLIPFPALDGGRILFLIIEKIKGSAISPKIANAVNSVGFLLLISLMIFVTFKDVLKLL